MVRSAFCFVSYLMCLSLVVSAEEFHWPSGIPRCKLGDAACLPDTLTQVFQHSDEIPELKIPKIDPFTYNKTSVLRTRNPNAPINIVIRNSDTTIYGLKNIKIKEVKGWGPDPKNTKFEITSFVPKLTTIANYKSTMNLFALPIQTEGVSNTTIEDIEIRQIIEAKVVEKDGKEYLDVKNVKVHLKVKKLMIKFDSRTGNPDINDTVNKVINENWRDIYNELKPDLKKNIGSVVKSLIKPMFSEVSYKDFFLPA